MAEPLPDVKLPPGNTTVIVKMINPVDFGPTQLRRFMAPSVPGLETFPASPSLCFLIEHPRGRKVVWDLGIRKDYENYSPSVAEYLPTTKYDIRIDKDVHDTLQDHNIAGEDIEAVIWSHWHWDHIGDPSRFPTSTDLVVGPGFKEAMLPGAPSNPKSPLLEKDYEGRNLREIDFDAPQALNIGRFRAFDYFGDGSFYLLDSPGHAIGHLCGLARTTTAPSTFILLGGDVCHYAGIFRPSKHIPLPAKISPHPSRPNVSEYFCPGHAWEQLQASRGRAVDNSLYDMTFGYDIPTADHTKGMLQELDCNEDIFVIVAHDRSVRDAVPHFPFSLNDWKAKGWGRASKWAFLDDLKEYWSTQEES